MTGGSGLDWMHYAFRNTTIEHVNFSDGLSDAWPFLGENFGSRIRLNQNWLTNSSWTAQETFSHELRHVWDINSSFALSGEMNKDLGGSSPCFFCTPGSAVPQWAKNYHSEYGNSKRSEYFAEAFSATIYNPTKTPTGVSTWVSFQISIDLLEYLNLGGKL